jgi:hypothetical protein
LSRQMLHSLTATLLAGFVALALAGCGKNPAPATGAEPANPPAAQSADAGAQPADTSSADADKAAELAAKEKELADREAAVKQQELEAELARRDAENAKQAANAAAAAAKKPAAKPAPAKPAAVAATPPPPPPPPPPIVVPAGTQIPVELVTAVTTKTAVVGDQVQGRLASDLVVGGRLAARAGSAVSGTVTEVVSGSNTIGGTPTLGIAFKSISTVSGPVAISARLQQQAASDTGKDTAKVVGTTAAGAIIGHQVSHKNGAVVGGLLGGATGLAIAKKTGGEVSLAAGTVVKPTLDGAVQFAGG